MQQGNRCSTRNRSFNGKEPCAQYSRQTQIAGQTISCAIRKRARPHRKSSLTTHSRPALSHIPCVIPGANLRAFLCAAFFPPRISIGFGRLRKASVLSNTPLASYIGGVTAKKTSGCSKRLSSKAATSEEARHTLRYVEPLSDVRTMLADVFSILLDLLYPGI